MRIFSTLKQDRFVTGLMLAIIFSLAPASLCYGQPPTPVDCSSYATVTTANERSTLDRRTNKITSTADVTITNISNNTLSSPIHAVISINNANGPVTMPEALGGPGSQPYGKYYYDLSSKLTNGQLSPGAKVTFGVKFVRLSTVRFTYTISTYGVLLATNQPPVANAGSNQTITLPSSATLNGTVTDDGLPSGGTLTITWSKFSGPGSVTFGNPGAAATTATFSQAGTYVLRLTANDSQLSSSSDVAVTVNPANQPPIANAGPNRTVTLPPGQTSMNVQLDGSGSSDPDPGDIIGYVWSGTPTPNPATSATPTVSLAAGTYTFTLVVIDNHGAPSGPSSVTITVKQASPPQLTINPLTYAVSQGGTLTVNASATHPDGKTVTLSASPFIKNATFTATPGTQAVGTFTFTPDGTQSGIQMVAFKASDPLGLTDTKTVEIMVNKVNHAPILSVPSAATINEGKILTIPVTASDPDGDILTLTAANLPNNAIFVPSAGTITFAPDYTQAGIYNITVTASDGQLSISQTVQVVVIDVPTGGGAGGPTQLTLNVDPVESPSFLTTQRITGTVNTGGGAVIIQPARSALITGMNPTNAEQGTTLEVVLTGDSGNYATHFASGASKANFGDGIMINSLSIASPTQATVNITIAGDAAVGPRSASIITGSETAVSMLAFNIIKGKSRLTGRIIDTETGQAIAGALVTIQGTNLSGTTDQNGYFNLTGAPSGEQTLLVNAPNYEMITAPILTQAGSVQDVGDMKTASTVFNPNAPSSVSLISLIGRKGSDTSGSIAPDEARQVVVDTWMLLGGQDAGMLDEYGNQQNPNVSGNGILSLKSAGIKGLADGLSRGRSFSLQELLYALSFAFQWSQTDPPPLKTWLDRFQQMVNDAWADPTNPDNAMTILVFNKGETIAPTPPTVNPEMRLNILQANALVSSFMIYALDPSGNQASVQPKPIYLAYNGNPIALGPINPSSQGGRSTFRNFWKNYFSAIENFPLSTVASAAGIALSTISTVAAGGGAIGATIAEGLYAFVSGIAAEIILQWLVAKNLELMVPQPPIPIKAELVTQKDGSNTVKVTFNRSASDLASNAAAALSNQIRYWYTLYRYDQMPVDIISGHGTVKGEAVKNFCSNCEETIPPEMLELSTDKLAITDPNPTAGQVNYYDMTTTRLIGEHTTLSSGDASLGSTMAWYAGLLPSVTLQLAKGNIIGPGILLTVVSPVVSLINGMKQLTSDFSSPVAVYGSAAPVASADEVEVDQSTAFVYYSDVANRAIYRSEWVGEQFMQTTLLANTGFKGGQQGLAVDSAGNLYTDNQMSDSQFGGRIFRFRPDGTREFAGSVNYFSQLLMFANPVSVSKMTVGPNDRLYVADEDCGCIKELLFDLAILEPLIVGQPYATLNVYDIPVLGMTFGPGKALYVLTDTFVQKIPYDSTSGSPGAPIEVLDVIKVGSSGLGGAAVDGYENIYISQKGATSTDGKILMYPHDSCASNIHCTPLVIMDNLNQPGDISLSKDGRSLFIATAGGKLEKRIFGVSGTVTDFFGNPLIGALVYFQTEPVGYTKAVNTDANGYFFFPELFRADLVVPYLDITVEYGGKTQVFLTQLGQPNLGTYGHTIRNITFSP